MPVDKTQTTSQDRTVSELAPTQPNGSRCYRSATSGLRAMACGVLVMLSGCAGLPNNVERMPSNALENTAETVARPACCALGATTNPGRTGVYPLVEVRDAFAARMLLARAADRGLDVQYYIWRDDTTGALLNDALWEAAERGVRVRLLLDDQNTAGLDETIVALDSHPNIEVRLFNPFANRHLRSATSSPTSRASTGACTTSRSRPTTRRPSSAAAT